MSENYLMPTNSAVDELLGILYGDDLKLEEGECVDLQTGYVANYISDEGKTVAVCVADNSFVANSGSSMMMIPAAAAHESAANNDIGAVVLECYYEVANILSRALMDSESSHLRLDKLSAPGENAELLKELGENAREVSFSVDIPGYGVGNVSFLVA